MAADTSPKFRGEMTVIFAIGIRYEAGLVWIVPNLRVDTNLLNGTSQHRMSLFRNTLHTQVSCQSR
jgi:hypothetical protein